MTLAYPFLLLLLPLPLLIRRLITPDGSIPAALSVPAGSYEAAQPAHAGSDRRRLLLLALAWSALVVALSGPRVPAASDFVTASGREIILVLDLSSSMAKEDFVLDGEPISRLDAVKRVASGFVAARKGDRIGLVIFGDRAYVAEPPTFDVNAVANAIETAQIGISGRSTAISDGLGLAAKRLIESKDGSKVIVLLSDGVDTSGKVLARDAAALASSHGIRVHTIALGPEDLETAPASRDAVDSAALRSMAEAGGGTSFRVRTMADLTAMSETLDALEPNPMQRPPLQVWQELWPWPGGAALALTLIFALRRRS
nr:VWA domain-containing protein [Hartmannibacter diazotrophicus]